MRHQTAVASAANTVNNRCVVASLALTSFHKACEVTGREAIAVLRRPPRLRKDENLKLLLHMFGDLEFFKGLGLQAIQLNVCRFLGMEQISARKTLYAQGDQGEKFYIIIAGTVEAYVNGESTGLLTTGDSFGDSALRDRRNRRVATIKVTETTILATLLRGDFNRSESVPSVVLCPIFWHDVAPGPRVLNR